MSEVAYLTFSDDQCILNGAVYENVPLVMSSQHRPVDAVNAFIRFSFRSRRMLPKSTVQKAHTLTNLCTFLESDERTRARLEQRLPERDVGVLLYSVDDAQLERWRNRDEKIKLRGRVINAKLAVAFRFLLFCSRIAGLPHCIADVDVDPDAPVKIQWIKRQYGKVIVSNLLFRGARTKTRRKGVPTVDEMADAYIRASGGKWHLACRNVLMLNVAEDTGLRLSEVLSLKISQLPGLDEIEQETDAGREIILLVVRKGGEEKEVPFTPDILKALHDYAHDVRPMFSSLPHSVEHHDQIFVAHSNGAPLNRQYASRMLSKLFLDTDKSRLLTYHRVRARFATVTLATKLNAEIENRGLLSVREDRILTEVMHLMGQTKIGSLRDYLEVELQARYAAQGLRRISESAT